MAQDYSDWLRKKTDVGSSQLIFDVLNEKQPSYDPGLYSSNGYRYSYLRYRASIVPSCSLPGNSSITTAYGGDAQLGFLPLPPITVSFTNSNNSLQNVYPGGFPETYILPTLPPRFSWSVRATATGGNGNSSTATKTYPAGKPLYIFVGIPGTSVNVFGNLVYFPGGASGVFENDEFAQPTNQLVGSPGGSVNNSPSVVLVLTRIYGV